MHYFIGNLLLLLLPLLLFCFSQYHAAIADEARCGHLCHGFYSCLCPIGSEHCGPSCLCYTPLSRAVMQSTYVQVLENRIEWNYPTTSISFNILQPCAMNCHVADNTRVLYFDRTWRGVGICS